MNLPCTLQSRHGVCTPQKNPGLFTGSSNGSRQFGHGQSCPELMSGWGRQAKAGRELRVEQIWSAEFNADVPLIHLTQAVSRCR
jgi:hypothetical protein